MNYNNIIKGFNISSVGSIAPKIVEYAQRGALKGVYLGYPNLHPHYSMSLPGVTDWTGIPQSGKSEVLMEFLLNTSIFYGWKHLIYVPDIGTEVEIISDLLHKLTGKSFEKKHETRISDFEIHKELPWLLEHFKILNKDDLSATITPYQFWELAAEMKYEEGLHTAVIDSWKDMSHTREKEFGRTDQYLENVLSFRNAMAEKHKMHYHTVIHPTKIERDSEGKFKPPSMYQMKGGTEWANSGKNLVTVHRPKGEGNLVQIIFNKIKPRSIGGVGVVEMRFDTVLRKLYLEDGNLKRYAEKEIYTLNAQQVMDMAEDDDLPF